MAEMNRLSEWFVNVGNARRSRRVFRRVSPSLVLPPSPRVLELGAGRGGFSALVLEAYHPRRLVVTDYVANQVESARAAFAHRFGRLPPGVELDTLDAKNLSFEDRSFDCVIAIDMLHHVEVEFSEYRERPGVLREIRRVLTPGGAFVWKDFSHTADLRRTLLEIGFTPALEIPGWGGRFLGIFRAPA